MIDGIPLSITDLSGWGVVVRPLPIAKGLFAAWARTGWRVGGGMAGWDA